MNRRSTLRALVALIIAVTAPAVLAAAAGEAREGIDYVRVTAPQAPPGPGVEVIEFFSYGCPHCNEFEPLVSKWRSMLPKGINFRRVPISFGNPRWTGLSKLYLTLERTGDLAKLHNQVFAAIHDQRLQLFDDQAILDWAAKQVADPKKFSETYQSAAMQAAVKAADQTGEAYGVNGVPSLAVAGRYLVVAKEARTYEDLLAATERVIELARKAPR